MNKIFHGNLICLMIWLLIACSAHAATEKESVPAQAANGAALLHAEYEKLGERLAHNNFGRPLYLDSEESSSALKGDVYARVDYPFSTVKSALSSATQWCEVLILHINVKYCHVSNDADGTFLEVRLGRKEEQSLDEAHLVRFAYGVAAAGPEYSKVLLSAEDGPLSTHDYRIMLESIPISGNRTFLHLTYSYAYGFAGRIAMEGYLATKGRDKVGFTQVTESAGGQPHYIGGVRGVVERNIMRYYLAIDAYLGALGLPPSQQFEKRLQSWFAATERYSRQLHEVDHDAYLEMKRNEYSRQQAAR